VDGIADHMTGVNMVAYADDMYFIYEADSWENVSAIASQNTKKAMEWLKKSGMVLNSSKTEAAYFSSRELTNPPEIEIDGNSIKSKPNIKVLGLIFDHKMSWDAHVEKLLKEDYDIIDILNTIDSKEKMEQYLLSFLLSRGSDQGYLSVTKSNLFQRSHSLQLSTWSSFLASSQTTRALTQHNYFHIQYGLIVCQLDLEVVLGRQKVYQGHFLGK
jgi:hypothetical protein